MAVSEPSNLARTFRAVLILVVAATLLRVWVGPGSWETPAQAQIPDGGLQRKQLIDEARRTNELLTDIKHLLEQGTLNVRVQSADNSTGAAGATRRPDK